MTKFGYKCSLFKHTLWIYYGLFGIAHRVWVVGPVCSKVININTPMNLFKNIHFIYIVL